MFADEILTDLPAPGRYDARIRPNLVPAFHFYIAMFLAAQGAGREAARWLEAAVLEEEDGNFGVAFLLGFLHRYNFELRMPSVLFQDPRPFVHFTTVPLMRDARRQFVRNAVLSLPAFKKPVRFMDIGCGSGDLTVAVLSNLLASQKIPCISEILLVEPSAAMAALAEKTVRAAFPDAAVHIAVCRIQDFPCRIEGRIDIAMSSLAFHHMPAEDKRVHLARIRPWIDHFLLFEMDADIDFHDLYSPALAFAVYQSFGRIIDCIYAHDAPVEVVNDCIDAFLMTEIVSILTKTRGDRSDYHMLRNQWRDLLGGVLEPEFSRQCDSACYADEYMSLFILHYGRTH